MTAKSILSIVILATSAESVAFAAPFVAPRDAQCVAFSPDGQTVAIGISGQSNSEFPPRPHPSPGKCAVIQWFDLANKKRLRRVETFGDLTEIAFSPDGSLLASARVFTTEDGIELNEVRVWDIATGSCTLIFDRCHAFAFAPQRSEFVVVSRNRCAVYEIPSGAKLRYVPLLANAIRVAYTSDGESICGIAQTEFGFALRNCEAVDGKLRGESQALPEPFYGLAMPRTGHQLATGHARGLVLLWDLTTLQPTARLNMGSAGRAFPFFSANGELLAAADQENSDLVIWELPSARELARYTYRQGALRTYSPKPASRKIRPEEDPVRFAFSPDGSAFLGGPFGGIVRMVSDGRDVARFGE